MPTYQVTETDGSVYEVDGPEGATEEQIIRAVQDSLTGGGIQEAEEARRAYDAYLRRPIAARPEEIEEPDIIDQVEELFKGIPAGAANILESGALGAITPFEEETELALREGIQGFFDPVQEFLSPDKGSEDLLSRKFGEALGSFAGIGATAAIPGFGLPAAVALTAGAGAGEASERAREGGATEEQRGRASFLGAGVGLTELLSPLRILKVLKGGIGSDAAEGFIASAKRVALEGGLEGLQEFAAGVGQNLIEQKIYNPEQGTFEGGAEQFGLGAGVGGFVRAVVELITPRRRTGGQDELTQGELFEPDTDLGAVPSAAGQGELFPNEDLGAAPERADARQLDLFGPASSPEGEQQELTFESVPGADAEQVAQAGARERAALAAAERNDETAFAQPDLFALQQEQEGRRLGTPQFPADQFMDVQEETEVAPTSEIGQQFELEDAIAARQQDDIETAQLEEMLGQEAAVRDESALETIRGQLDAQQQQETAQQRSAVLDSVLTDIGTASRANIAQRFSQALADAGVANTTPTQQEYSLISRATDAVAATRTQRDDVPPAGPVPSRKEARAQKGVERTAKDQAAAEQRTNTRILTEQDLEWGPKQIKDLQGQDIGNPGPARDRMQQQLEMLEKNAKGLKKPNAIAANKAKQQRARELLSGERRTASGTSSVDTTQGEDIVDTTTVEEATPTDAAFAIQEGETDGTVTLNGERIPASDLVNIPVRTGNATPVSVSSPVDRDTAGSAAPANVGVGDTEASLGGVDAGQGEQLNTLIKNATKTLNKVETAKEVKAKRTKKPAPKKPTGAFERAIAATTARGVGRGETNEEYPNRGRSYSEEEIAVLESLAPYRYISPENKERLRPAKDDPSKGNYSVEEDIVPESSPFTSQDAVKIAKLIDKGTVTRDDNGKAAKVYLGNIGTATQGLASAVYDSVYKTPVFTSSGLTKEETAVEKPIYGQTGGIHAGRALAWAKANLSPTTQAWIAKEERRIIKQRNIDLRRTSRSGSIIDGVIAENDLRIQKIEAVDTQIDEETATAKADKEEQDFRIQQSLNKANDALEEKLLQIDQVVGLDLPTHPEVNNLLRAGKLKEALRVLAATSPSSRVSQMARKYEQKLGDTKVEVVENLTNKAGVSAAGLFDPETNTVKINATTGINAHTILHENTHALTSATLANPSHPLTKQLTKLFDDVKDSLGTYYGSQNVDEFAAEASSNLEFRQALAGINPKGSPISALQKYLNIIGNFVRRMLGMKTKPLGSALNQADQFIEAMLAPAPDSRDAGELLMSSTADGVKRVMEGLGKVQKKFSKPITSKQRQEFSEKAVSFLQDGRIAEGFKTFLLGTLGTKSLADVSLRNGFGGLGLKVHQLIGDQRGDIQESDKIVNKFIKGTYIPWADANPKAQAALDRVIYSDEHGATIYQVDPTRLQDYYKGKTDDSGNDLEAIWKAQRKDWNIVQESKYKGKTGVDVFSSMRKLYKDQYEKLEKVINGEIDALMQNDPDAAKRLKNEVFAKLFEAGKLDVYFPLVRQGRYKLSYAMKNPKSPREAYVVRMFDTKRERNTAKREAEADEGIISIDTSDGDMQLKDYSNAPPTSFVKNTLDILRTKSNADTDTQEAIMRLFIQTLPETSFAKSLQRRKGTPGYIQNSLIGLRTKAYDIGRQAVRLEYAARLRALEGEINGVKEPTTQPAESLLGKTKDSISASFESTRAELLSRAKFARLGAKNKGMERFYKTANQGAFVYTIGFNVSSAIVNLSQIPLFAFPYMVAQHGLAPAYTALAKASRFSKLVMIPALPKYSNGKLRGGEKDQIDDYYDVDLDGNYTVKSGLKLYDDASKNAETIKELKRMAPIVKLASQRAYLGRSFLMDELGLEEGGRQAQGNTASKLLDNVSTVSAYAFNAVERFNRQTIAFANYDLILTKLDSGDRYYSETQGKYIPPKTLNTAQKEELAAEEALYQTEQLNGGMSLESAPRIAQEGLGRVAFMYKGYGMNMYYAMFKSTARMLDTSVDPALRKQAMYEIVGTHGSALLIAGVHGVPLYGIYTMIANLFLDDEDDDADTIVRKYIKEGWYKGPLNATLGVDIASRTRLSGLLFQENRYNSDPSPEEFLGFYLGGPALSSAKRLKRGYDNLREGYFERGIENLLPPGIANAYKASFGRYAREGGIYNKRQDPIYDDITTGELVGQFFGFAPTGYTFEQERNQALMKLGRNANDRRSKLLRKLYLSYRMGDAEGHADTLKEVRKFNDRYSGTKAVISIGTMMRSIKANQQSSVKKHNGINLPANLRGLLLQSSSEWGG